MRVKLSKTLVLISLLLFGRAQAAVADTAADPIGYQVRIAATGSNALDAAVAATAELVSSRETAPVSGYGLIARARHDAERLAVVMESFGYYQSTVRITINDRLLDDFALPEILAALPVGEVARVAVGFALGPLYHLRQIDIDGDVSVTSRAALRLMPGDPAIAASVLAARTRLLEAQQTEGYAFAVVDAPVAYEDRAEPVLDLVFRVRSGAPAHIGLIQYSGLERVQERAIRHRIALHHGDLYHPALVEQARRELLALGVFATVSVQLAEAPDANGDVAVGFAVRERRQHAVAVNAAYATDLGGSAGFSWTDRDFRGTADQLVIAAAGTNLGGHASKYVGYDASAKYITTDWGRAGQTLQVSMGLIRQSLQAYDQEAQTLGVTVSRPWGTEWRASMGISAAEERVVQQGRIDRYTLIALPLGLSYDSTQLASPLDDPRRGARASLSLAPTTSFGTPNANFLVSQLKASAYLDLQTLTGAAVGRSILAVRALAGVAQGAGQYSLPPDQRFYGGGSGTIRGFRYQSVGPQFADGTPIGGTAIVAASVEWRQRIAESFGAVVFADIGQVSSTLKPLPSVLRTGVGVGLRYYTPIGPLRLDVGLPTHRSAGTDAFQVYIGLGQAF